MSSAWPAIRRALERQRDRGLRVDQLAAITRFHRVTIDRVLREHPEVERTGERSWRAAYYRLKFEPESVESEESMTAETEAPQKKIWGDIDIPVIGVSGEFNTGKTCFLMMIDPEGALFYDLEKSGSSYSSIPIKERIDVPLELNRKFPNGYKPIDLYSWWREDVKKRAQPGVFTNILVDPASDLDQGLADFVASRYADYGFSSEKSFTSMGGVFWGNVRSFWKQELVDIATRCQTFAFTTHMRTVWSGGKPTSRREPLGKSTLMELASLYLVVDRKPDDRGKVPKEPRAIVRKSRLAKAVYRDGNLEIVPILPPSLKTATPNVIRQYIANPPDYAKLKKDELVPEEKLSDDDKLELQAQIAADQKAAAEAELQKSEMMIAAARRTAAQRQKQAQENAAPDQSQQVVAQQEQDRAQEAAQAESQDAQEAPSQEAAETPPFEGTSQGAGAPAEPGGEAPPQGRKPAPASPLKERGLQHTRFIKSVTMDFDLLGASEAQRAAILGKRGVKSAGDLNYDQAEELAKGLQAKVRAKGLKPSVVPLEREGN